MVDFKPEGYLGTDPVKGLAETEPLTDGDLALMAKVFKEPSRIPANFWAYLLSYIEANPPLLPISQISGFSQFTISVATRVNTNEITSSATYGDLATVGPTLAGLSDGRYAFIFGCTAGSGAARDLYMALKVNATEAIDADAVFLGSTVTSLSGSVIAAKTLSGGGNNTVTARYKTTSAAAVTVGQRWLAAIKYGN